MELREKAIELADGAVEQVEAGGIHLDTADAMAYAIVLALADVAKQLDSIKQLLRMKAA